MSQLYTTETGRVVPTLCEELTRFRRARKVLTLPPTAEPAMLFILARPYPENGCPLRIAINGRTTVAIQPVPGERYAWYAVAVEPEWLCAGDNTFELWTDSSAMNAWSLALEPGHTHPRSWVSDDAGRGWRNERMGYLNVLRGEYVVRLRLAEGQDPPPPTMVWEDPASPRLASLRRRLPDAVLQPGPALPRVRTILTWLSESWEHTSTDRAAQYAPWDAETILAWGAARRGHAGQPAITYCVHYAAACVSACQAAGIPARGAALLDTVNGVDGHFVTEVWLGAYGKWVMADPNLDAVFWEAGVPLSLPEIRALGADVEAHIEWGPGIHAQRQNPRLVAWLERAYYTGRCFLHRSLWPRADLLSRPDLSPPGHGSLAYCETGLVWEPADLAAGFGMFPHFGSLEYFEAPPEYAASADPVPALAHAPANPGGRRQAAC
jgi:hypothetical protein